MAENDQNRTHVRDLIVAHKRAKQLTESLKKLSEANSQRYGYVLERAESVREDLAKKLDILGQQAGLPGW